MVIFFVVFFIVEITRLGFLFDLKGFHAMMQ